MCAQAEDARAAGDGNPEVAAAAATQMLAVLGAVAAEQLAAAIPVQADYFLPDDERRAAGEETAGAGSGVPHEDDDAVSQVT